MRACVRACVRACNYACIDACMYACMYVLMYVGLCMYYVCMRTCRSNLVPTAAVQSDVSR